MRHVKAKLFSFFIIMLTICACMPAPYVYHRPYASGGELMHTGSGFGSSNTIEFRVEGIKLQVKGQDNWLYINVYLPEGKLAQFVSDEIGVYEDNPDIIRKFNITRSSYYDGQPVGYVTIRPTDRLVGRTKPLVKYGFAGDRLFEMSAPLDEKERDHFYVKLPALRVGEQIHEIPVIKFIRKTGFGIMFLNG